MVEQLVENAYQVRKADNGAVALQSVKEEMPDIIFVDILMPVMDGLLFVSELREIPETSEIPVVLVTAIDLSGVISRAKELGVKHLLAKPWEEKSLDLML